MENPQIPQDDFMDVWEITQDIENLFLKASQDNDPNLVLSALISATINCTIDECETLDQVVFYRNVFMNMFDNSIEIMRSSS